MSRNTRARRLARKNRPKLTIPEPTGTWGDGPPLTAEERSRVLQRYSSMSHRGTTVGFVPLLADGWVKASTPEELEARTKELLEASSAGDRSN